MQRFLLFLGIACALAAQQNEPKTIPLWPGAAPGALGTEDRDIPTLSIYLPPPNQATGAAVVICPGGGYGALALNHEGRQIANWLNSLGVAAFVLKYRLGPRYRHPIELGDAQRSIRIARAQAAEWGVDPARVGIWGFSAGGHLASTASTHFDEGNGNASDLIDRAGSRPDFAILAYPVITFNAPHVHAGSRRNLLGDSPDPKLVENLSNDLQVTSRTPPTFLFHTNEDKAVPVENSVLYFMALRKAGVPAEMHIFEHGPHGVGLAMSDPALSEWPGLLVNWMRGQGLLRRK